MAVFRPRRVVPSLAVLGAGALLFLAGCSKADQQPGPVAARVNADEISMAQLASAVARLPDASPERRQKARRDTLDMLVDQQLAAQMAQRQGLEHDPEVMRRLDTARREILARSYLARVAARVPAPSDEEVGRYYDAHPLLYAQRRYYVLREIALPLKAVPEERLRALAARATIDETAAWLHAQGVTYSVSASQRAAEDIPPAVLEAVSRMRRGATTVVMTDDGAFVVNLLDTRAAPVELGTAAPRIRRQLADESARLAVLQDIARIKQSSRIEYGNEFADAGPQAPAGLLPAPRSHALLVDDAALAR